MLNIFKLLNCMPQDDNLNEAYLTVPTDRASYNELLNNTAYTRSRYNSIYIRNQHDATHGGDDAQHATSIKVRLVNRTELSIPVPTKAYSTLNKADRAIRGLNEFMGSSAPKEVKNLVRSFIYTNQMAIVAYWYCSSSSDEVAAVLLQYMKNAFAAQYKGKNVSSPKTADQLEDDKEALIAYVRSELQNDTVQLYFGA